MTALEDRLDNTMKPHNTLKVSTTTSKVKDGSTPKMIYLRPTIDLRMAVWVGLFGDPDPRPTPEADYYLTVPDAETALPVLMEETGEFFGVCYIYLDN